MTMAEVTFLVVDDDEIDVELLQRAFRKLKIANPVVRARDGLEALDVLRGTGGRECLRPPYIILLDINMPRMTGLEFLNALRGDATLAQSIVFVLATSDDQLDIYKTQEMLISGYIVKNRMDRSLEQALSMIDNYWKVVELPA